MGGVGTRLSQAQLALAVLQAGGSSTRAVPHGSLSTSQLAATLTHSLMAAAERPRRRPPRAASRGSPVGEGTRCRAG